MIDTPETDNLARGNHVVPTEFAQDLERERNEARWWLRNLLAIIHGDGGHHTEKVGMGQSVSDAHEEWAMLKSELEYAKSERDDARAALEGSKVITKLISAEMLANIKDTERERDEARKQCLQWLEEWHLTDKARRDIKAERDEAIRQRNETSKSSKYAVKYAERERDQARGLAKALHEDQTRLLLENAKLREDIKNMLHKETNNPQSA